MATGDQNDITARLTQIMPRWFGGDSTPIVSAVLAGAANVLGFIYSLIQYARLQTRIKTATGGWLDIISYDYLGPLFPRQIGQADDSFRAVILRNIFRVRVTRAAVTSYMADTTSNAPTVTEFFNPVDCGAYGALYGYGAGKYGSILMPNQALLEVNRAGTALSTADIYTAVNAVKPVGVALWTKIDN